MSFRAVRIPIVNPHAELRCRALAAADPGPYGSRQSRGVTVGHHHSHLACCSPHYIHLHVFPSPGTVNRLHSAVLDVVFNPPPPPHPTHPHTREGHRLRGHLETVPQQQVERQRLWLLKDSFLSLASSFTFFPPSHYAQCGL